MAGRHKREWYTFVSNEFGEYYRAEFDSLGVPIITKQPTPRPLKYNPSNLIGLSAEFATNTHYRSLNRAITYPFTFIKDGAAIMRHLDYETRGYKTEAYLTLIKWNSVRDVYELYYRGKFDFVKASDDPITGFTINTVDGTAWGVLSQRDDVAVQIPCDRTNPKAIKVLFDGITLLARYIYQPVGVQALNLFTIESKYLVFPLVNIATDGDSFGIIHQDQTYDFFSAVDFDLDDYTRDHLIYFFKTQYATTIHIEGKIELDITAETSGTFGLRFFYWRSTDLGNIWDAQYADRTLFFRVYQQNYFENDLHETIYFSIDADMTLVAGESISFICLVENLSNPGGTPTNEIHPIITSVVHNIVVSTKTNVQPTTAYALRPLDLAQQVVQRATNGRHTIDSEYYKANNRVVCTCGDALRNAPIAYIHSSFRDWYQSYSAGDFLAMRSIDGNVWIEEFETVYDQTNDILELGEISDVKVIKDEQDLINEVHVGSPKQDYRHPSGRFEFNGTNKFSLDVSNVKAVLDLISKYRRDGFGAEFIRLDYQADSTTDNPGDTSTFMVAITDEFGAATTYANNFFIITIDNSPLAPIITSPFDNDNITNQNPTIRGRAPNGTTIFIYVDTVFDGSTVADTNGNWIYNIVNPLDVYEVAGFNVIETGTHAIDATFSDLTGETSTVTVTILPGTTPVKITSPLPLDEIVDNQPIIRGVSQSGEVVTVDEDGVNQQVVTADGSGKWQVRAIGFINTAVTVTATGSLGTSDSITFAVNSSTVVPIITKISGYDDNFVKINNLPLIEGVAIPGTVVNLYLDYYPDKILGSAIADAFGNWSFQVVPVLKLDGTTLTPIPNGEHILSTDLAIKNTPLQIEGYKLDRPAFSEISGVTDNTVFNVPLSPKRMLLKWKHYIASLMVQNKDLTLYFEEGDKNQSLKTVLDTITIQENSNEEIASFGDFIFYPIIFTFKTVVPITFNKVFNLFNSGGCIHGTYYGQDLWFLPIGRMSVEDVTRDVQSWKLLVSKKTSLETVLNLYREGLTLEVMRNALFHSDYNQLHFVKYDYQIEERYHAKELYDDWFEFRNDRWRDNPYYLQKVQMNDIPIVDQIITNGVSGLMLVLYRCYDGTLVDTIPYQPFTPTPIQPPDIAMEAVIDMSQYPEDQYFFVIQADGVPVAISERIVTAEDWPETILIESKNSTNLTGFIYSAGTVSRLRLEGLVQKWQPDISLITNRDEIGDNQMLHSVRSKKRKILIGKASGLPDYMYIKASKFVLLDTLFIEGINYVADKENKLQEQDRLLGHPLYHYELDVELATNEEGVMIPVGEQADILTVIATTDAEAFGFGGGQLIDIIAEGE